MQRFRTTWDTLRTSFWFVPGLMAVGGLALTAATVVIESKLAQGDSYERWFLYMGDRTDSMVVLSAVLSSMVTMASLVFSITMVVLTLAASQFGPRLIRNFMGNPQTQIVLGVFVMTAVYCLLAFPLMELREEGGNSSRVSVSIALLLALVSVGLLVLFLDNLARSIVSETVIERVGAELDELLGQLRPLQDREERKIQHSLPADFEQRAVFFGPGTAGYVKAVEFDDLVAAAKRAGVLIGLYFRAGHYVVPGAREIAVYPKDRLSPELAAEIQSAIVVGVHRTPVQDPDFAIRHLDEIATRALSAAVNDPYTAVAVIDRLSASLCRLMERALPAGEFRDPSGTVRVVATSPTYAGLIGTAFNQIRQHGAGMPIIVLHLLEAIERLAQHVRLSEQHAALSDQAEAIMEAAQQRIEVDLDRRSIADRYRLVQKSLLSAALQLEAQGNFSPPPVVVQPST